MPPLGKNTKITLGVLAVLFLLQVTLPSFNNLVHDYLLVSAWNVIREYQVWTILTSVLWHQDASHLFMNGLTLFFFAGYVEAQWNSRRFWTYCLICALGSGLTVVLWQTIQAAALAAMGARDGSFLEVLYLTSSPTLGYSGVLTGLLAAFAYFMWDRRFNLFFFPMTGKTFFFLIIGVDIVRILMGSNVSMAGHMGGLFVGLAVTHFFFSDSNAGVSGGKRKASDFQKDLLTNAEEALAEEDWREAYRVCHQLRSTSGGLPEKMMNRVWEILAVTSVELELWKEAESYIKHAPDSRQVKRAREKLEQARAEVDE
ncbi:MAG: rhomboid family intramembrane serine protease [Myxococcota bacterium]